MSLPASLDPRDLPRMLPGFAHWFRYRLHDRDFHALHAEGADGAHRLLGYYAAKPLYGKLDARGRVDRSAGFSGEVVAAFVPSPARSWRRARIVRARTPRGRRTDGKRDWPAIRRAVEAAIRRNL